MKRLIALFALLSSPAWADPVPGRPLAVPIQAPAPPDLSPDKLNALRSYKTQRLSIRDEVELIGGGTTMMGGFGYPYSRYGWAQSSMIMQDPLQVSRSWGVYQGVQRLSVTDFLRETHQTDLEKALQSELRKKKARGTAWFTLGGAGFGAIVGGMVMLNLAENRDQALLANRIILAGTGGAALGLLAGAIPRGRAAQLDRYPATSMAADQAQDLVNAHNDALREALGLTPAEVWPMEMGQPAP
jgi:hypothetical protein